MKKIRYIVLFASLLLIFVITTTGKTTSSVDADDSHTSVTISKLTDPRTLKVYQPFTWSNKVYIDLTEELSEGSTINSIQLQSAKIFSNCGQYRDIYLYIWDEEGNYTRLESGLLNKEFVGKSAAQKFYLRFYTNYMEHKGNPLIVGRPMLTFDVQ